MKRIATWLAITSSSVLLMTGCSKAKEETTSGPPPNERAEMEAMEKQSQNQSKEQTTCPVMGGKINKDLYADVNGKRIYVCCEGCIATIKKDPAKYIAKLEAEGVTLAPVPKTGD